ncbi:Glutathione reductase, chloroplastic [Vitis vinifera]|uniref:Glutathione reductase, chloroplastic n=1 Tax=Vitis vinifera TaxID=29760 RepID=A0A438F458_VITVI|nr:Glutathione reductase, chloroplastic [Vitis vinifera]
MAAATSLSTPRLTFSSPKLQTLYRNFPISLSLNFSSSLSHSKTLTVAPGSLSQRPSSFSPRRCFAVRAESEMGPSLATTTSTSSPSAQAAAALGLRVSPPTSVLRLPFVSFLLLPYLPRPPVALAARKWGFMCVLRGCVPKKLLVYASKFSHEFDESGGFGWKFEAEPKHDWSTLMANKNAELQRLTGIYKNILKNAGVTLIEGRGKIVDPHTVDVDGKLYTARHILIAVGGRPFIPEIPGSEHAIDSDAALDLPSKPKKIGNSWGWKKVLRGFDEDVRDFVAEQMSLRGIEFHTEESPQAILKSADGSLSLKTNKGTVEGFSHIMFATGRRPNTKNLGLETVGVKMTKTGAIEVDEFSRTSVPSIWAVGDVTDRINLTPVALMEGGALAKTLFGNEPTKPDYRAVPSAVFSQPPIGQVGLTEEQAIQKYGDIDVYTANFRPLKATLSGLPDRVFMKLIVCAKTNKVLGLHMCGEDSPEIVAGLPSNPLLDLFLLDLQLIGCILMAKPQGFAVAVRAGLTKADFDATVGIHPTAAEELVTMRTPTRKIRNSSPPEDISLGNLPFPSHDVCVMSAWGARPALIEASLVCMVWNSYPVITRERRIPRLKLQQGFSMSSNLSDGHDSTPTFGLEMSAKTFPSLITRLGSPWHAS